DNKPLNFITAIRDTYGSVCNQTIFYTNSEEIQKKAADQYVIVVDSTLNGFYWSYFQQVVDSSSKVPAQWTYIGDEQGYLSVQNLRKLVRGFNHRRPLIFGRIFMQKLEVFLYILLELDSIFFLGCCSDHAISFGQLSYKDIRLADFASVHWKVFGLGGKFSL
ncbi:unnamed protein product, partial [Haemonchus placei]|uniref:ANF_receptor domain-containing protein n=1 Tax=Haemonchus placei TaxID=6290 RepID=A0A0N4WB88_HAEPC